MTHSATTDFWTGEGGDAYLARNRVDWTKRSEFWRQVMNLCPAERVLEVGANAGWNLRCIREHSKATLRGVDLNASACCEALAAGLTVIEMPAEDIAKAWEPGHFGLVFTAGMLIHVPPEQLRGVMEAIVHASGRWVLAIEYESDHEEEVEYRGQSGLLWKRPYGELYEQLGLRLVWSKDAGEGFDRCRAWMLERA